MIPRTFAQRMGLDAPYYRSSSMQNRAQQAHHEVLALMEN